MRRLAFAFLLALAGCSAADDFDKFKFVEDGGHDLAGGDMAGTLPGFGEACNGMCQPGASAPARPLMCETMFGGRMIPNGDCTRACIIGAAVACTDYGEAVCGHVEGMDVCLRACDPTLGHNCRAGFACCANNNVTTGPGACAPANTDFCGAH